MVRLSRKKVPLINVWFLLYIASYLVFRIHLFNVVQFFIIQINTIYYFTFVISCEIGPTTCRELGQAELNSFFIWIGVGPGFVWADPYFIFTTSNSTPILIMLLPIIRWPHPPTTSSTYHESKLSMPHFCKAFQ